MYPDTDPETIAAAFGRPLPETGSDPDTILDAFESVVLPNATHTTSPRFFGYVMGSESMLGTLADVLAEVGKQIDHERCESASLPV